jgi:glyoxylase-like metal-dependent hydrolase (beta-lactamase superfamily II)
MQPLQLFDPASSSYTYVLFDASSRDALIIDPIDEQIERDLAVLQQHGLRLLWTLETHAHADHITSARLLAEHTGARTAAPEGCGIATAAVQLRHGETLHFGARIGNPTAREQVWSKILASQASHWVCLDANGRPVA